MEQTTPAASARRARAGPARASASTVTIMTCLPVAMARSAWSMPTIGLPVASTMTSMSASNSGAASGITAVVRWASASSTSVAVASAGQSTSFSAPLARSTLMSAMPTTWTPGMLRACARYMVPNRPAPMRPTRIGRPSRSRCSSREWRFTVILRVRSRTRTGGALDSAPGSAVSGSGNGYTFVPVTWPTHQYPIADSLGWPWMKGAPVRKAATIRDVAREAGVSVAVVSRVLNEGTGPVAPRTRARVVEAIDRLGYLPRAAARGLQQRSSTPIGLVLADLANTFFARLADRVVWEARARGIHVVLLTTQEDPHLEAESIETLIERSVGSVIATPTGGNVANWSRLLDLGINVVFVDREIEELP